MEFDYKLYPGRKREEFEFEEDGIEPKISIITSYYNGHKYIDETMNSVLNQTFPYWEWIIVDDGSTNQESLKKLEEIGKVDKRIKIVHKENTGTSDSKDFGVTKTSQSSDYILFLDDDDLLNRTYLECAFITLETNKDASWAYTDLVNFGGQEFLWTKYFDSEIEKKENLLVSTALIRKKDFKEVNGHDLKEKSVYEDWNLWLKLIAKEKYPVRMNYYGFWYRKKPQNEGSELARSKDNAKRAHEIVENTAKTITKKVEAIQYPKYDYNWDILGEFDFNTPIRKKDGKKHILLIFPWFAMGGADKFNLDFIMGLDSNKYEFTIVTTEPCTNVWRQQFEECAKIYDLTTFLDRKYWPCFINYLIKKENIEIVLNSNSKFGYAALPYIKACNPYVHIMDYIHMEEWYNRNGGFSRDTSNMGSVIEKTLICNDNSRKILINHFGRDEKSVETVYIGVDAEKFDPDKFNKKELLEKYKIDENINKIGFIARIDIQKRPYLLMNIIKRLRKQRKDFVVIIAGNGPLLDNIKKYAKKNNLEQNVRFLGAISNTGEVYAMSDITLNCSIKEGLALTSYESLSMGVPVVSANVGGQAELIDDKVGAIVPCIQKEEDILDFNYSDEEIQNYVDAINKVLDNLDYYKQNSRNRILEGFSIKKMVEKMDETFDSISKNDLTGDEKIVEYKDIFKELITNNIVLHGREYEWLCEQLNVELFGYNPANFQSSITAKNNMEKPDFKTKLARFFVRLHLYQEAKIVYKGGKGIITSIKIFILSIFDLLKQLLIRIRNLFRKLGGRNE